MGCRRYKNSCRASVAGRCYCRPSVKASEDSFMWDGAATTRLYEVRCEFACFHGDARTVLLPVKSPVQQPWLHRSCIATGVCYSPNSCKQLSKRGAIRGQFHQFSARLESSLCVQTPFWVFCVVDFRFFLVPNRRDVACPDPKFDVVAEAEPRRRPTPPTNSPPHGKLCLPCLTTRIDESRVKHPSPFCICHGRRDWPEGVPRYTISGQGTAPEHFQQRRLRPIFVCEAIRRKGGPFLTPCRSPPAPWALLDQLAPRRAPLRVWQTESDAGPEQAPHASLCSGRQRPRYPCSIRQTAFADPHQKPRSIRTLASARFLDHVWPLWA